MDAQQIEQEDVLIYQAQLSLQLEAFVNSDVGGYLLSKADEEAALLVDRLKLCDPSNITNIIKLQEGIKRAESFRQWISDGIEDGLKAMKVLEHREEDE